MNLQRCGRSVRIELFYVPSERGVVESWDRLVLSGGGCKVDLPGGRSNPNEDC